MNHQRFRTRFPFLLSSVLCTAALSAQSVSFDLISVPVKASPQSLVPRTIGALPLWLEKLAAKLVRESERK
jgi:hypothetical protein